LIKTVWFEVKLFAKNFLTHNHFFWRKPLPSQS
jgi:hypothetical protein